MSLPITLAGGAVTATGVAAANGSGTPLWVTFVVAIISSGGIAYVIHWLQRRQTGEGKASAVKKLMDAAAENTDTAQSNARVAQGMVIPLTRQVAALELKISQLESKLAEARKDTADAVLEVSHVATKLAGEVAKTSATRHQHESDLAALRNEIASRDAKLLQLQADIDSRDVRLGDMPDRRQDC